MGRKIKESYLCQCGETNKDMFYSKNKSKCKKCSLDKANVRYRTMSNEDKLAYCNHQKEWASNNIVKVRVLAAKHRSKRKNITFDIDEEFINNLLISQNYKCYYSGVLLDITSIGGDDDNQMNINSLSIDRKDSKLGYIKSNVVLVIAIVNTMKNDLSEDIFLKTIDMICSYNKGLKN